jgi:acyl carrier protein
MAVTIDDVLSLVAVQLGRKRVAAEDRLVEDLGAESLDLVNIVAALEDLYGIDIPEEEIADLRTVADLHARVAR